MHVLMYQTTSVRQNNLPFCTFHRKLLLHSKVFFCKMVISRVRLVFKSVLCVVILYSMFHIAVYFDANSNREISSTETSPENIKIKKFNTIAQNKSITINVIKTTVKENSTQSNSIDTNNGKHVKNWRKVIYLNDQKVDNDGGEVNVLFQRSRKIMNYYIKYTQENEKNYQGVFFKSWPPFKNRSIVPYMNESFTIIPKRSKLSDKTLIVIVQSIPSELKLRNIWRRTWGKYANKKTSVLFLLGKANDISNDTDSTVLDEHKKYGDIVQIDGLIEHYNNLTFKSLYTLKFFLDTDIFTFKSQPKYLLKVDTDTIVNLPKLYHQLTAGQYKSIEALLLGCCYCCGGGSDIHCSPLKPIENKIVIPSVYDFICPNANIPNCADRPEQHYFDPHTPNQKKWEIPSYIFNGSHYPSYLNGHGYVLSRRAADCIYRTALKIPFFPMEDVYVTGFVAQECDINRLDHTGFHSTRKKFDYENDVVNHLNCGDKEVVETQKCYSQILDIDTKYHDLFINEN